MSRKPVKFGWKPANPVAVWKESPRFRQVTQWWFISFVSGLVGWQLSIAEVHFAFRLTVAVIGTAFMFKLMFAILDDCKLKDEMDALRIQIDEQRKKFDEAIGENNTWLADLHRVKHDELVQEHQRIRDKILGKT